MNPDDDDDDDDDDEVPILVSIPVPEQHQSVQSPQLELLHVNNNNDTITVSQVDEDDLASQHCETKRSNPSSPFETTTADDNKNIKDEYTATNLKLPPCPVTILSGFLGSGKTTLINYILHSPNHGKRIAVIENEYGESTKSINRSINNQEQQLRNGGMSVESIIARDGPNDTSSALTELLELPNGCICCTVKDRLVSTLELLVTKKRTDIDYILIECSGLANPGPIASLFWLDDTLESRLCLDGIVTIVDCTNILHQLQTTTEASSQIAYADRILLNKIDLLVDNCTTSTNIDATAKNDNSRLERSTTTTTEMQQKRKIDFVIEAIRSINPTVSMIQTSYSQVPNLDWILDTKCFSMERIIEQQQQTSNHPFLGLSFDPTASVVCLPIQEEILTSKERPVPPQHTHSSGVSTITITVNGSVSLRKINQWLASLLWPHQDEQNSVLQAKLFMNKQQGSEEATVTTTFAESCNRAISQQQQSHDGMLIQQQQQQADAQQEVFRIKGILSVYAVPENENSNSTNECDEVLDDRRYIVQAVYDLWEIYPCINDRFRWDHYTNHTTTNQKLDSNSDTNQNGNHSATATTGIKVNTAPTPEVEKQEKRPSSLRYCTLIFIGRHLQRQHLIHGFESTLK